MYMLRTRLASFTAGFAAAAAGGFYFVHSEIQTGNHFISDQVNKSFKELDARITNLENNFQSSAREQSEKDRPDTHETESAHSVLIAAD
ncbi:hypothetical protein KP509_06G007800 [Ceratopteris richardii]|uniref:Uncharacterized protein n=1 Tax=Ceratopteris richardii TaxID=49495 RepID=A0A8T2UIC2_CERRI|nr:hypothetical protein KP509_06G007800 [Ceratopteris richardii]